MAERKKKTEGAASLSDPGFMSPMPVRSDSKGETWDAPFAVPTIAPRDPLGIMPGAGSGVKASSRRKKE